MATSIAGVTNPLVGLFGRKLFSGNLQQITFICHLMAGLGIAFNLQKVDHFLDDNELQ